jgi:pilus assembly protein CpaB
VTQLTRRNVLLVAVMMAAATTFVAYLFLTRQQVQALSSDQTPATQTMVVVARREIRPLQLLRPEMFAVKQVRADSVPRDAVATPADLKEKVALVTMAPGQMVTERQVAAKSAELGLAYSVKPPLRAVTVALDPIIGVAGFPKPGNHVDVLATFTTDYGMVTRTVLQDVEILALGSELQAKEVDPETGKVAEAREKPTATLAVLPGEAERLILAENRGKLRLALRPADDTTYRSRTGTKELAVVGIAPTPKNPVTPPSASTPSPALPTAKEIANTTRAVVNELRDLMPAPPVLPPVAGLAPPPVPAPKPETPEHVITVIRGTEKEVVKFKKSASRPYGAGAASDAAEEASGVNR